MNLIKDVWLPIIRKDGTKEKVAIHRLLDGYQDNPVIELMAPRPDFKNALYQLLIGIVQVAAMPEDEEDWSDLFKEPYSSDEFSKRILKYEECFEIDSAGPAFMQDFDLTDGEEKMIAALLIEAPGRKTIKGNQDHFVKSNMVKNVDIYWAAIALYTMQTFAPSGGAGHRVGLRGGGPLTTILMPSMATLWGKIWFNIISNEYLAMLPGDKSFEKKKDIFPWMKISKLSKLKGSEIFSVEVHPFYHYFGMPRRMRLNFTKKKGVCDLTGEKTDNCVVSYITKNYGNNYDGTWGHPLNAYMHDPKKLNEFPLSIKGQPGGVGYRHWLGLVVESERVIPAIVVTLSRESNYRKEYIDKQNVTLWVAGYDMDNMKARCWYESTMPFYPLNPGDVVLVSAFVSGLIEQAREVSSSLRFAVKSAWFGSPKDAKGDMTFLDTAFWKNTESSFYSILDRLIKNLKDDELKNGFVDEWGFILKKEVENLFDANALAQQEDGLNMKRVVKARLGLGKGIAKMKKNLKILQEVVE